MVCLGFKPRATGWEGQTKPQNYVRNPNLAMLYGVVWLGTTLPAVDVAKLAVVVDISKSGRLIPNPVFDNFYSKLIN